MNRTHDRRRSSGGFEEIDEPLVDVERVVGRVSRSARVRPVGFGASKPRSVDAPPDMVAECADAGQASGPTDSNDTLIGAWWVVVTTVAACTLALGIGGDGPWIIVVPALAALYGAWLDRRISFSFAEGLIGYRGDPEPAQGVLEGDEPTARQRSAPAAP